MLKYILDVLWPDKTNDQTRITLQDFIRYSDILILNTIPKYCVKIHLSTFRITDQKLSC